MTRTVCWTLTDGGIGMVNQAVGLAEALGLQPQQKVLTPRFPWKHLAPQFWLWPLKSGGDPLTPPWPDLLISCGNKAVAPAIAVRKAGAGHTTAIHIQDPVVSPRHFDLVVAPSHDRLRGDNVIISLGAIGRVNGNRLAAAANAYADRLAHLPRPLVAVLVGGSNACYRFTPAEATALADQLDALGKEYGAGFAITASRRTGTDNVALLWKRLNRPGVAFWDGEGENPYFGYLSLADHVVVTADSVNMVTEAAATGKPVHIFDLPGASAKFRRFHEQMRATGITRPMNGRLDSWHYTPLAEADRCAAEARRRLGWP